MVKTFENDSFSYNNSFDSPHIKRFSILRIVIGNIQQLLLSTARPLPCLEILYIQHENSLTHLSSSDEMCLHLIRICPSIGSSLPNMENFLRTENNVIMDRQWSTIGVEETGKGKALSCFLRFVCLCFSCVTCRGGRRSSWLIVALDI